MFHFPMADSMDIAFLLVNILSDHPRFPAITNLVSTVIHPFMEASYDIRLALIKSMADNHSQRAVVHPWTSSVAIFNHGLATNHPLMGQTTNIGPSLIHESLRKALNLAWRSAKSDGCHENVVFLITHDVPCPLLLDTKKPVDDDRQCACDDLWTISNEFNRRNVTLVILGVDEIVSVCDILYARVAKNTGGEYIPFNNAARILLPLTKSIIKQGYTVTQSLRHVEQTEFEVDSSYTYSLTQKEKQGETKHCPMMARKGEWLLAHHVN